MPTKNPDLEALDDAVFATGQKRRVVAELVLVLVLDETNAAPPTFRQACRAMAKSARLAESKRIRAAEKEKTDAEKARKKLLAEAEDLETRAVALRAKAAGVVEPTEGATA